MEYATKHVQVMLDGATWTNLDADVVVDDFSIQYGVEGNGPFDLVASTGSCQFILRNDARPGKLLGRYSPNHVNKLAGWTFGIPFRVVYTYAGVDYPRFRGKIRSILPDSGPNDRRQVEVIAYDVMRDLAEANLLQVDIQVNKNEAEIITAILDAVPTSAQPVARSIDSGIDTFQYALDDLGGDTKALTAIAKVARSSFVFVASHGDGTLVTQNRHTHVLGSTRYTFTGDMNDLDVPSDMEGVVSVARTTTHPKTVIHTPVVLYALTGTPPSIVPGQTFTIWGSYNDSDNAQRLIGGLNFIPLDDGIDYAGNSLSSGVGTDLTSSLSIAVYAFATAAKFEVTNIGSQTVYLVNSSGATLLQIRGDAVRDLGPQTFESATTAGGLEVSLDLEYQDNPNVGQSAADFIHAQRNATRLAYQPRSISFLANRSAAKMIATLSAEPGDQAIITESVTGLTAIETIIQSISLEETDSVLRCTWGLAPASPFKSWQVEVPSLGAVESMIVGF